MTPKEKAKELYLKYCPYDIEYCDPLGNEIPGYYHRHAKYCATITVDEIIKALEMAEISAMDGSWYIEDWKKVKQEIKEYYDKRNNKD